MAEENGATGTLAVPETQPPAGTTAAQAATADGEHQPESLSLDEARKLRSEAASLRRRLKDFEEAERKRTEAELSETQRLQKRLDELETERTALVQAKQEQALKMAVLTTAGQLGFTDPKDAIALLDRSAIQTDPETGEPTNIRALLADLLKTKSYLSGAHSRPMGSADGGTREKSTAGTIDDQIRAAEAERAKAARDNDRAASKAASDRLITLNLQKMASRSGT